MLKLGRIIAKRQNKPRKSSSLRSSLLTSLFKKLENLAVASEAGHLNPKKRQCSPLTWDSYY
ncbi:hypothetical protein GXB80_05560 [Paenibacillus polymyxa]|nr:hypothetical protein [Paenibacillus polymyxa]